MDKICRAYSAGDDSALSEALHELQQQLTGSVQRVGPAVASLQLRGEGAVLSILNRLAGDAEDDSGKLLAFRVGFLRACFNCIRTIADHEVVDLAAAKLLNGHEVKPMSMAILKGAYTHAGAPALELIPMIAGICSVSQSKVELHLQELLKMRLIEQTNYEGGFIAYRVTHFGGAVLSHLSKPNEIALFFIDKAASNKKLRMALREQIKNV